MNPTRYRTVHSALAVAVALTAAACSGGGETSTPSTSTAPPTTAAPQTAAPTTTVPPTTLAPTTVPRTTAPQTTLPPATVPADPVMPLTGAPVLDPKRAGEPAIVVKIDNHPNARPQTGINEADLVIEEIVEGGTRFFAVFHSVVPERVGPVRSGRTTDVDLVRALNKPLFVWSGGNKKTTRIIADAPLVNLTAQSAAVQSAVGFFRSSSRRAPHNLYASGPKIAAVAPADSKPPQQVFLYRPAGVSPAGIPGGVLHLNLASFVSEWTWDAAAATYRRTSGGRAQGDADGRQTTAANVVVMTTRYGTSVADPRSPEAITVGDGALIVMTGGNTVKGRWIRFDASSTWTLFDEAGQPILLSPGHTWIALAKSGDASVR